MILPANPAAARHPLRLRVETQLGYKMVKYLRAIDLVADYRNIGEGQGGSREDMMFYSRGGGNLGLQRLKRQVGVAVSLLRLKEEMMSTERTEHRSEAHLSGETTGTSERPSHLLAGSVLAFDLTREIAGLQEESAWQHGDRNAKMLVKEGDFRVVLIALRAGARMERHQAAGRITVQTLAGHLRMQVLGETVALPTGQLISLERDVPHDVEAVWESAFLLTIGWHGEQGAAPTDPVVEQQRER